MTTSNRLLKEFKEIKKEKDGNFLLHPNENNLHKWSGKIRGPVGTPYQDSFLEVICYISNSYPVTPPVIKFKSKIFHPNVHPGTGEICLDILKNQWTPAWTLLYIFKAILILLSNPEPNSPLNCDAGNLLRYKDHRGFVSLAYMYSNLA
nr:ubiquitin-conjugating enzyme E2-21 KD [Cryptomonas sp.]